MQDELISRRAVQIELKNCKVVDMYDENDNFVGYYNADTVDSIIRNLPPVNPQYTEDEIKKMQDLEQAEIQKAYEFGKTEGQKTGHWIYDKIDMNGYYLDSYECSVCKCSRNVDTPYCPMCGAKMVEPQESENDL